MQQDYFGIELSGSVHLALPLENLVKVTQIDPHKICLIPGMAPCWLGVINYQGSLLWVLETNRFFELICEPSSANNNLTIVIIQHRVKKTQRRVGLVVNQLRGILTLNQSSPGSISSSLSSRYHSLIQGITFDDTTEINLLDFSKFFQVLQTATFLSSLTKTIA